MTKVKDKGKRCLGARWRDQGSRVCIELGVQGLKSTPHSKFHEPPRNESIRLWTIGSSKCLSGSCFHVEQELTSRLTGRLNGPPGKYERWLSSASSGSVGIGYDNRPGELTVACRNRHASSAFV
ncbi:hypothetical protein PIB30_040921 [Stylosanthes scabra]|uniref:Uncharacterized protein n=1 Tax=Stylosanthes scabra TaxID=79078 RepID=A0ABU6XCQ1_9FABA|nr:hypothetical protein [Stylosanthes scabra]